MTLLQVVRAIEATVGRQATVHFEDWRPGDQKYFVADASRAAAALGLRAPLGWRDGLHALSAWLSPHAETMAAV